MSDNFLKFKCLTDYLQIYKIYTKIDSYLFISVSLVVCELWGYNHQKMIDSQDVSQGMLFNVQQIRDYVFIKTLYNISDTKIIIHNASRPNLSKEINYSGGKTLK